MFKALEIIKPFWYFHISNQKQRPWPDPENIDHILPLDKGYDSKISSRLDGSFILLMNGWLPEKDKKKQLPASVLKHRPSHNDEFRFLGKYFHPGWSLFYLLYCIFKLKNPLHIIIGYVKSLKIERISIFNKTTQNNYPKGPIFSFPRNEKIRIIIPTYNRYSVLKNILRDLETQDYPNFSITIIDQSNPFDKNFYNNFKLDILLIHQENPGLWEARNKAVIKSNEKYLAFLDDDSRISHNWLECHLECIEKFDADISAGVSISLTGAKIPENYSFYRLSDQLDTGNVLVKRHVFEKCQLFDEQFEGMRMGDGEFGFRAYEEGFLSISNPNAKRIHLKTKKGGLRELGSWDALRPTNILKPRPIPSTLYFAKLHFGKSTAYRYLLSSIPFSLNPYFLKNTIFGSLLSVSIVILILPILIFQIMRSWLISNEMIKQGPIIPELIKK